NLANLRNFPVDVCIAARWFAPFRTIERCEHPLSLFAAEPVSAYHLYENNTDKLKSTAHGFETECQKTSDFFAALSAVVVCAWPGKGCSALPADRRGTGARAAAPSA